MSGQRAAALQEPTTTNPRRTPPSAGGDRDPDPTARVGAVACDLLVDVKGTNPLTSLPCRVVQPIGRHDPGDLELQPVWVLAVQALRRAVVRRADEGAVEFLTDVKLRRLV